MECWSAAAGCSDKDKRELCRLCSYVIWCCARSYLTHGLAKDCKLLLLYMNERKHGLAKDCKLLLLYMNERKTKQQFQCWMLRLPILGVAGDPSCGPRLCCLQHRPLWQGYSKGWGAPLQPSTFRLSIVPTKLLVLQCRLVTKSAFMQTYTAARAALLELLTA